ncbi:hypothetical protein HAX54_012059 [Datura stramonium]|uniref:Uncharacterized protein n=1 Tax=Datura stramonium TaxID=4076 RepID=A0ABS8TJ75_DATST|nr:hypothetical protein [Datura stramonium]
MDKVFRCAYSMKSFKPCSKEVKVGSIDIEEYIAKVQPLVELSTSSLPKLGLDDLASSYDDLLDFDIKGEYEEDDDNIFLAYPIDD